MKVPPLPPPRSAHEHDWQAGVGGASRGRTINRAHSTVLDSYDQHGPIRGYLTDCHTVSRHVFGCSIVRSACQGLVEDKILLFAVVWKKKERDEKQRDEHKVAAKGRKKKNIKGQQVDFDVFPSNVNQSLTLKTSPKMSRSLFPLPYTAHLVKFNKLHASKTPDPAVRFQK